MMYHSILWMNLEIVTLQDSVQFLSVLCRRWGMVKIETGWTGWSVCLPLSLPVHHKVQGVLFWRQITRVVPENHNRFTALFQDHPVEPVLKESFFGTSWCKGRLTDADTRTIRLGATPSGLTSAHLHHPPLFYRPDALPATQLTVSKH